jgi:2'-5' RNA ligase
MIAHRPGKDLKHSEGDAARPWRCFLAWLPPEPVLDALAAIAAGLAPALPPERLRWLPRESVHLTLRFLGDCDAAARDRVAALLAALPPLPPIPAHIAGIQYLPSNRDARVLVLRVESDGLLERFAAALEAGVREQGFAPEPRPFRAHVTIARLRPGHERPGPVHRAAAAGRPRHRSTSR